MQLPFISYRARTSKKLKQPPDLKSGVLNAPSEKSPSIEDVILLLKQICPPLLALLSPSLIRYTGQEDVWNLC